MAGVKASDFEKQLEPSSTPRKYMLIDGNNILIRAAKATQYAGMESSAGVSTSALHVFITMLARHVRMEDPTHLVVCWDGGRSAYRTELYDGYKAHRKDRGTEDEEAPFGLAKRFLTLAGVPHVERPGWEADDLIACYWRGIPFNNTKIVILSSDKDLLQLVGADTEQVRVSSKPPFDRWTSERVREEMGLAPADIPKMMALTGDPGDGVPGIRGIGPVKAVKRLVEANWNLDLVGSLGDFTDEQRAQVKMALKLVDLRNLPYNFYGLALARLPEFVETDPAHSASWLDLIRFVDEYDLQQIKDRLTAGTLWREEVSLAEHPGV